MNNVLLPVPFRPTTRQTSVTVTLAFGITMVRSSGLPSAAMPQAAVGLDDHAVPADPGGVPDAAGETPGAGHPVAALDRDGALLAVGRAPRQHRARIAENVARDVRRQIGGRHRAARALRDAPGGAGVGLGDLLDHLHVVGGLEFHAVAGARHQHAEQPGLVQRGEHLRRDPARGFGFGGVRFDQRAQAAARARCSRRRPRLVVIVGRNDSLQHAVGFLAAIIVASIDRPVNAAACRQTLATRAIAMGPRLCDKRGRIRAISTEGCNG